MTTQDEMKAPLTKSSGARALCARMARSGAVLSAAAALLTASVGCSATDGFEAGELETRSQDLDGSVWKPWFSSLIADTDVNSDPAICNPGNIAWFIATQNTDSRYYLKSAALSLNPSWKQFGSRQFNSAPTCASQKTTDFKFVLAGRSTDGRMYAIEGVQPPLTSGTPSNPNWTGPWAEVSGTTYSGSNGRPALGSNGSRVILAFKNGSRISVHQQALPYSSTGWNTTAINSPNFPSGVSVSGIPAVTYISGSTNRFVVMVRGTTSSGAGLYWIYFTGTAFQGSWTQAFIPYTVSSDPALEYASDYGAMTLYFRSGDEVIQTSAENPGGLGIYPFYPIPDYVNADLRGAPRAATPAGIEGTHTVIIRGYEDSVTTNPNRRIMWAETAGNPSPWPQ